jgi:hypothetical protein
MNLLSLPVDVLGVILAVADTSLYAYRVCRRLHAVAVRVLSLGKVRRDVRSVEVLRCVARENLDALSTRVSHLYVCEYEDGSEVPIKWYFRKERGVVPVLVGIRAHSDVGMLTAYPYEELVGYLETLRGRELILSRPLMVEVLRRRVSLWRHSSTYVADEIGRVVRSQLDRVLELTYRLGGTEGFLGYRLEVDSLSAATPGSAYQYRDARPVWLSTRDGMHAMVRSEDPALRAKTGTYVVWRAFKRLRRLLRCQGTQELGPPMKGGEGDEVANLVAIWMANYDLLHLAILRYVRAFQH